VSVTSQEEAAFAGADDELEEDDVPDPDEDEFDEPEDDPEELEESEELDEFDELEEEPVPLRASARESVR